MNGNWSSILVKIENTNSSEMINILSKQQEKLSEANDDDHDDKWTLRCPDQSMSLPIIFLMNETNNKISPN